MEDPAKDEVIKKVLMDLEREGRLSPYDVVDAARDPTHVLHNHFEWDDTVAAERFRLSQARRLIRSIELVVIQETRVISAVAYVRDPVAAKQEPGYSRVVAISDDHEKARAVVLAELARVQAHLARARSLASVLGFDSAIERMEVEFSKLRLEVEASTR